MGRGLLQSCDAKEMLGYQHSGFSVDEITLTPLELIARIAALVPPQRYLSHRTSPRQAGLRCGVTVVRRRWMTGCKLSQIGTWRHNPFKTTRWTSASIGDSVKQRFR